MSGDKAGSDKVVMVPVEAWDWLFGLGDSFDPPAPTDRQAKYWWRSEFRRRIRELGGSCEPTGVGSAELHRVPAVLDAIHALWKEADEERWQEQKDWERQAEKWKAEGDMYGWNFHQGMGAGANWCSLFFDRIRRKVDELRKAESARSASGDRK
jgi:hypothetical protein